MEYTINISYKSGNSFNSYITNDIIDLTFKNIDVAKDNLKRIKEHQEFCKEINDCYHINEKQETLNKYVNKDWFVLKKSLYCKDNNMKISEKERNLYENVEYRIDQYLAYHSLILKTDDNENFQLSAFWNGYFEKIISAQIISDDLKIEF